MNKKSPLKIFFIGFVFLLVIFLMTSYLLYQTQKKSKASGEAVTVSLSPSLFSFTANQDLSTTIKIQPSIDMTIRGYYLTITFDKTKLQLKNIEYKLGTVSQDLSDDNSKLSSINQTGTIKIVGEIQSATGYILPSSKQTEVASLTFSSISDGSASIAIDSNNSKIIKINADSSLSEVPVVMGGITPSPTGGPTPTLTPTPVVTGVIVTTTPVPYPTSECKIGVATFAVDQQCTVDSVSGFRYAYYICYDGYAGILGEETTCKSSDAWFKYAEKECEGRSDCNPLPSTSPPSPPPEGPITISLKLRFQGIMKKPPDQFNNQVVKVTVFGGPIILADESATTKNPSIFSQQVNFVADDSGVWTGTVSFPYLLPGSDYRILTKGPKHIQKKICNQVPTETYPGSYHCGQGKITLTSGVNDLDFSGIYQLVGDLPEQDGIVNSYDVSLVRNSLNKGDTDSLRLADLNLDGVVNAQDYSLVIAALSIRSDEE